MSEIPSARTCPHCGGPLPARAPEGLCPRCLLRGAASPTEAEGHARASAPSVEQVAAAFPHLEIVGLIGQGGMGCVFKARQPQLNRFVALKILPESLACDPAFSTRFAREAQALAKLSHPHIVTVHDFGQAAGLYYLLMEFVDGVNLREALRGGRFTPEQALAVVPPICDALQYAHDHGVVHRDIKPENLLLGRDGQVKIADFGIARMLDREPGLIGEQGARTSVPASGDVDAAQSVAGGTPRYMAPEQRSDSSRADHRSDIYSLGVVLYELLTGELPDSRLEPPSRKVQIDVRLDEIVLRALQQEPERRYATAAEFRTSIDSLARDARTPARESGARVAASPSSAMPPLLKGAHSAGSSAAGSRLSDRSIRHYGRLAMGLFLLGVLGTPALIAVSRRDELALAFGVVALVLALVFGVVGRKRRLGKAAAVASCLILLTCGLAVLIMTGAIRWPARQAAAEKARQAELKAMREIEAARAAKVRELEMLNSSSRFQSSPPVVAATEPVSGTRGVPPGNTELRVRFSKAMQSDSWSWVSLSTESTPAMLASPRFEPDGRTCVLKVKLEPGKTYAFWLNSAGHQNFKDTNGVPAVPYLLTFETAHEASPATNQ